MQMNAKVQVFGKVLHLRRTHSKIGEIITWEVLDESKSTRIGVIRQLNDHWQIRRVGWQQFAITFWLGTVFYPSTVVIGRTRTEVLKEVIEARYGPIIDN